MAIPEKPDAINKWASDSNFAATGEDWDGTPTKVEVPSAKHAEGFEPGETLFAQYFNHLVNHMTGWIRRLVWAVGLARWNECRVEDHGTIGEFWGVHTSSDTGMVIAVGDDGSGGPLISAGLYGDRLETRSHSIAGSNVLYGVCYSDDNDIWVVVGQGGKIATAPLNLTDPQNDGGTWTNRTSGTTETLYGVAAGNGDIVAVGANGTILYSAAGTSYTARTSGTTEDLRSVCWNDTDNLWVVVGETGTILTSPDTVTWTARTSGTTNQLYGVCYDQSTGNCVAVGNSVVLYSTDCVTWVLLSTASTTWFGCAPNGSEVLAVGLYGMRVTADGGATWDSVPAALGSVGASYGSGTGWVVCGSFGASGTVYKAYS